MTRQPNVSGLSGVQRRLTARSVRGQPTSSTKLSLSHSTRCTKPRGGAGPGASIRLRVGWNTRSVSFAQATSSCRADDAVGSCPGDAKTPIGRTEGAAKKRSDHGARGCTIAWQIPMDEAGRRAGAYPASNRRWRGSFEVTLAAIKNVLAFGIDTFNSPMCGA